MKRENVEQPSFYSISNRDAYASIRGYVFQVQMTIQRWLNLKEGEVLELECGEDIDHISSALGQNDEEFVRTLEQVKYRKKRLSLRSQSA